MSFQAADRLAQHIADHVGRQIITGEYVAGDRIPEWTVVEQLGVSRSSVREALLLLERRQLVALLPRRGAVVVEQTPASVRGLFDVLIVLSGLAMRRLAERAPHPSRTALEQAAQVIAALPASTEAEVFHESVVAWWRCCHPADLNPSLAAVLAEVEAPWLRALMLSAPLVRRDLEEARERIQQVTQAVMSQSGWTAAERIEDLMLLQRQWVLDALIRVKQIEMAWVRRQRS